MFQSFHQSQATLPGFTQDQSLPAAGAASRQVRSLSASWRSSFEMAMTRQGKACGEVSFDR